MRRQSPSIALGPSTKEGGIIPADYQEIAAAASELAVTVGIIEASINQEDSEWPEEVKENFEEKISETLENIRNTTLEFLQFGSAFDGEDN